LLVAFCNFSELELLETTTKRHMNDMWDHSIVTHRWRVHEKFGERRVLYICALENELRYESIDMCEDFMQQMCGLIYVHLWRMYLVSTIHNLWHFLPHQWNENRFPAIVLTWSCRTTPDVDFQQLTRHLQDHHESKVISIIFLTKPTLPLFLLLRRM
jgi:hypothetical protein